MSEVEKQESQKTVVAFITGLLIGGLLVWVFSSTPAPVEPDAMKDAEIEMSTEVSKSDVQTQETTKSTEVATETIGEGSLSVANQTAGSVITLGDIKTPTKNGWVVVRDYMDGVPGNVLGAARYSADEGLIPTTVELIRNTVSGSSYQAVFYTQGGDNSFKIGEDTIIEGTATTFKAN